MPKTNKATKIRELLKTGASVASIAKRAKVSPNYVYQTRYKMNSEAAPTKKKKEKVITVPNSVVSWEKSLDDLLPLATDTQIGGRHYRDLPVQPAAFCHKNGIGKLEGDVIYYVTRWRDKGGVSDLEKARHTLDLMLQLEAA